MKRKLYLLFSNYVERKNQQKSQEIYLILNSSISPSTKIQITLILLIFFNSIDDFGVSVAFLSGVSNSGQTFTKCRDLTCDAGTNTLRKL